MPISSSQTSAPPAVVAKDLVDAVKIGALAGGAGFLVGTTAGVLRSSSPILFGAVSSLQWFGLGSTFWAGRCGILSAWHYDQAEATPRERLYASAMAGGLSGIAMALLTRGRRNVLPAGVMFSLLGGLGQGGWDSFSARSAAVASQPREEGSVVKWIAKQNWSPFSILSNEEYEKILQDKILRLEVEISLIDDRLEGMRKQQTNRTNNSREADGELNA